MIEGVAVGGATLAEAQERLDGVIATLNDLEHRCDTSEESRLDPAKQTPGA